MIIPNVDDHLVSALLYREHGDVVARSVILSRPHPNRQNSFVLITQRINDNVAVSEYQALSDDITEQLRMLPTVSGPFAGDYVFYRFPDDKSITELLSMAEQNGDLYEVIRQCLGVTAEVLRDIIRWKG